MKGKRKSECADGRGLEANEPWPDRWSAHAGGATFRRHRTIGHLAHRPAVGGFCAGCWGLVLAGLASFSCSCRLLFKHAGGPTFTKLSVSHLSAAHLT